MSLPTWFQNFLQRFGWKPAQYRRRQRPQRLATRVLVPEERILMFGLTDDAYAMEMNAVPAHVLVLANDNASSGPLEITGFSQPMTGGSVSLLDNPDGPGTDRLVFTVDPEYAGDIVFTYTAQDATGNQATANVNVEVSPGSGYGSGFGSGSGSAYSSGSGSSSGGYGSGYGSGSSSSTNSAPAAGNPVAALQLSTSVDRSISFQIGGGASVTFSGNQLGDITSNGTGSYLYTPHSGAIGTDHFTASYQPSYGGGGYGGGDSPPPVTTAIDMNILMIFGASDDDSYQNPDPGTQTAYPEINYFVLKNNTLAITADKGVLKNDTIPQYVQYLTAEQVGNGQYGSFDIDGSGAFTYTPYAWVFDSPLFGQIGLEDSCQYVAKDPLGQTSQPATVTVDLVELYIMRNGVDVDTDPESLNVCVGEKIAVSVGIRGQIPAVPGLATFLWCIDGNAVDGYTGYSEGETDPDGTEIATELNLTGDEIDNASVDFYWLDGGTHGVNVYFDVMGQLGSDDVSFNVNRPDVTVTASASIPRFGTDSDGEEVVELAGDGMTFERTPDFTQTGSYRWTQIVDYDWVTWRNLGGGGGFGYKDGGIDNAVELGDEEIYTDTPSLGYQAGLKIRVKREFGAHMYLMYKHNSPDSIWVSLSVTEWSFEFTVKKNVIGVNQGIWEFEGEPQLPTIIGPIDTTELPEWDSIYRNDDPYLTV